MPSAALEMDVRTLAPPQRHPEVFRIFDALEPNGAFVLVNDHDPKPLLRQFQKERPGRFDWNVLESGPDRYRVEIRRREGGARSVAENLGGDHRRLDAILDEVEQLAEAVAFEEAGARFAEFACGLGRHIDVEENVLFPPFERRIGSAGGPTFVMRAEHVEIRNHMAGIAAALAAHDQARAIEKLEELRETVSLHNLKEERILYPALDQMAGDDDARNDLVKQLQAF